ncbi:MAG: hypothetical protein R2831_10960 [Chitinophagaceae bacterium]
MVSMCGYRFYRRKYTYIEPPQDIPTPNYKKGFDPLAKCHEMAVKHYPDAPGGYNHYNTHFCHFCKSFGIDSSSCIAHLQSTCPLHNHKETKASVSSTYATFSQQFGQWKKESKSPYKSSSKPTKPQDTPDHQSQNKKDIQFWYEVENPNTRKIEYKFAYDDAIEFLQANGFYRYPLENDNYQFIHRPTKQ